MIITELNEKIQNKGGEFNDNKTIKGINRAFTIQICKKIPYSYWNIVALGTRCKKTARVRNVYDKYNINQGGN